MLSYDPAAAEAVTRHWMTIGVETVNDAVIAIRVMSALGRVSDAFALANAYHLGQGFTVPHEQNRDRLGVDIPLEQRDTSHLFEPVTRPMRSDPRFERLVQVIGLDRYWRESGIQPDYRRPTSH